MLDTKLTPTEKKLFEKDLCLDHQVYFRVHNMSLDHVDVRDISDRLMEGQVTVSAAAEVNTRSLSITFLDPEATLGFDSGDPSDGVMFADRMLRVYYEVYSRSLSRWVSIVVFTGPVVSLDRSGSLLTLEASGKEVLAREVWGNFTIKKGTTKNSAIAIILRRAGEKYFGLQASGSKLGANLSIAHPQTYWLSARKVAQSIDKQLYYDAYGRAKTRAFPVSSVFTFHGDDGGSVLSDPVITYNPDTLRNVIRVVGKKPKKGATPAYNKYAPESHPLSGQSLIRGGRPGYRGERFQSDSYRTVSECKKRATTILNARLKETIEVKFDSMVIPHLEPYDICTIKTDKMSLAFALKSFTIPLTPDGVMTVGYVRKQSMTNSLKQRLRRRIK